ncbi:MAG: GTP 3',8-cyclase MoaA [Nitrospirae bacterium]|nr:GTP 3',8-cyclase MoaA [Nitrospirota bacterium]
MARDSFDREIDYLRISITDRCGLRCVYCSSGRKSGHLPQDKILTAGEIARIVQAAVSLGVRKVRLTGGEPLLRDDLPEIISSIKHIGIRELSLTTNGQLLAGLADELKQAGLDRVNVSLDSLVPERYRKMTGGGSLSRVLDGIEAAYSTGLAPVKINMVPIRGINEDEIPAFARLTLEPRDEPYHVRFIEFMPVSGNPIWDRGRCVPADEVLALVEREVGRIARLSFRGKGPSRNYRIDGAPGIIGLISPLTHGFCYRCNRLRISASGFIKPCLFSNSGIDIGTPVKTGADAGELARLLRLAIEAKPEGKYLDTDPGASISTMSGIGG